MALQEELEQQGNWLFKYRGILPLFILLIALIVYVFDRVMHADSFIHAPWYDWICFAVCMAGQLFRIYIVGHTPKNTSGRNTEEQLADQLNTTGVYSTVRHPLYVGNFLMWFGAAMLTQNIWFIVSFVFIYWVYYERIMFAEEQFLRGKFGDTYLKWAEKVPAFWPSLSNFVKPVETFSWKKVVKKEKNGILAVFLVFLLFKTIGDYAEYGKINFELNFWSIGTAVTLVFYLIIKVIRKGTTLLNEDDR